MNTGQLIYWALISAVKCPYLLVTSLRLSREHLGRQYKIPNAGTFTVFRDTIAVRPKHQAPVVLIFHFRLKLIGSNRALHWLFQRVCILTTPFWSGLPGFRIKLWLVDHKTKNYMGIYEWWGKENTRRYVAYLTPILGIFAQKKSMWHKILVNTNLDQYSHRD